MRQCCSIANVLEEKRGTEHHNGCLDMIGKIHTGTQINWFIQEQQNKEKRL